MVKSVKAQLYICIIFFSVLDKYFLGFYSVIEVAVQLIFYANKFSSCFAAMVCIIIS